MSSRNDLQHLAHHPADRKTGDESFHFSNEWADFRLRDFWQWSVSDLVSNATRGRLAEYIIASALDLATGVRTEWDAFDLRTHAGLSIEVKSCAYLQSWEQNRLSTITFSIRETRAWDSVTGLRQSEALRQAQLYIFALLIHQEGKATLDPLNLDQWRFYPVLTSKLNERSQGQQSLGLRALEALCPVPLHFNELRTAVRELEAGLGLAASSGANE